MLFILVNLQAIMSRLDKELEEIDYSLGYMLKSKWIISLVVIFLVTIISYIPFEKKLESIVYTSLASIPGCPMSISSFNFELFAPKVVFKDIVIPSKCLPSKERNLKIDKAFISFRGISFSPFGLSFKAETRVMDSLIEAYIIPSFTSISILLENESDNGKIVSTENQINLSELSKYIPKVKLIGHLVISTGYFQFGYDGKIKDMAINLASSDIAFPTQKIMGYKLQKLDLKKLLIQIDLLKNDKMHLKKFIIGSDKSPLITSFTGDIRLNQRAIKNSNLDITGELKLDESLLENNLLLQGYLNQFDKKDKFYQIQMKGKLGRPSVSSAR